MFDKEMQNKLFWPIINQFQNVKVHCRFVEELSNWHIEVHILVELANGHKYSLIRSSASFGPGTDEKDVAIALRSLVHTLRQALCHAVFHNPEAPDLYKEISDGILE